MISSPLVRVYIEGCIHSIFIKKKKKINKKQKTLFHILIAAPLFHIGIPNFERLSIFV